eukprot:361749_1
MDRVSDVNIDQATTAHSPDTDNDLITINNSTPSSYMSLITNEYFCARILIICVSMFLSLLSLSYTIGQVLSLQFEMPFCDKKTADEVSAHSKANKLNGGESKGCWSTKLFTKNEDLLWSQYSYTYTNETVGFRFIGFMFITLIFILLIVGYIYKFIIDIKHYRLQTLGIPQNKNVAKSNTINLQKKQTFVRKTYDLYLKTW